MHQVEGSAGASTFRVVWEERTSEYKAGAEYWETFRDPVALKKIGENAPSALPGPPQDTEQYMPPTLSTREPLSPLAFIVSPRSV